MMSIRSLAEFNGGPPGRCSDWLDTATVTVQGLTLRLDTTSKGQGTSIKKPRRPNGHQRGLLPGHQRGLSHGHGQAAIDSAGRRFSARYHQAAPVAATTQSTPTNTRAKALAITLPTGRRQPAAVRSERLLRSVRAESTTHHDGPSVGKSPLATRRPQGRLLHFAAGRHAQGPPPRRETAPDVRGAEEIRTPDPLHAMEVRYQLRHSPAAPRQPA